jgi:ABC-type lipoprotein export system ATPase subunit
VPRTTCDTRTPPQQPRSLLAGRNIAALAEQEASRFRLAEPGVRGQSFDLLPGASAIDNATLKPAQEV